MPVTQDIPVRRPSDLTAAWAQRIIAHHAADVTVSEVKVLSADVGTTTRVRVAVEHNGPETVPRRWFVKLPSRSWRARCMTALPRLRAVPGAPGDALTVAQATAVRYASTVP
jgi:hypothetical protein